MADSLKVEKESANSNDSDYQQEQSNIKNDMMLYHTFARMDIRKRVNDILIMCEKYFYDDNLNIFDKFSLIAKSRDQLKEFFNSYISCREVFLENQDPESINRLSDFIEGTIYNIDLGLCNLRDIIMNRRIDFQNENDRFNFYEDSYGLMISKDYEDYYIFWNTRGYCPYEPYNYLLENNLVREISYQTYKSKESNRQRRLKRKRYKDSLKERKEDSRIIKDAHEEFFGNKQEVKE